MKTNTGHIAEARAGLNMIELLVAMVVLSLVVTMMAAIFRHSEAAWTQGAGENEVETAARVALDMITRDLQGAVADSNLTFAITDSTNAYGPQNSEIAFIALQGSPTLTTRAARAIRYWVREMANAPGRYELIRASQPVDTDTMNCYSNRNWYLTNRPTSPQLCGVAARNVSGFLLTPSLYYSDGLGDSLPRWVDICLDVLSERDALQAAKLTDNADFVERTAKRFTTRVHFPNRNGYKTR
jgi:prepilin-type N-terminal cleavage/methylation domain-containing protein